MRVDHIILASLFAVGSFSFGLFRLFFQRYQPLPESYTAGWVYISGDKGSARIGMTQHGPKQRLQAVDSISNEILYMAWTENRYVLQKQLQRDLSPYRDRHGLYDRDATLMYISHLRGEA